MDASLRLFPAAFTAPASSSSLLLPTGRRTRSSSVTLPLVLAGRSNLKPISLKTRHDHGITRAREGAGQTVIIPKDPYELDYDLREEGDLIEKCFTEISNTSILHREATELRRYLCLVAKDSVRLVSTVMAVDGPRREKLVLQMYARTFVSTAEDAYQDKVTKETVVSFLGALEGVEAMSYFIVEDTLASPGCIPDCDVHRAWHEYQGEMDNLRHEFEATEQYDAYDIVRNTVTEAIKLSRRFVNSMTVCRENALRGLFPGATRAATV